MTVTRRALAPLVGAALAVALLGGCAAEVELVPDLTPSAAFASEKEAFAAVEETYRAYNDAFNRVDFEDFSTFMPLAEFTGGDYAASERKDLSLMSAEGLVRGGEIVVEWFRLEQYEPGVSLVARTCNNVAGTTFTDAAGTSLVPEGRPIRYALNLTFEPWESDWKLVLSEPVEDSECPFA